MLPNSSVALVLGTVWGVTPMAAIAQQLSDTDHNVSRLSEVTVSSTRTERRTDNVPNTVTVVPAAIIEQQGARDIKDIFRDEVDVTVRFAPTRFTAASPAARGRAGNESINIRGLEGNQVLMLIDGIRMPNSFSFSSFSTGRGDFLDVDGLKTVEVLRGPTSIQFGSDGLGGAASFITFDPTDLLKPEQQLGGFVRSSYVGLDRSSNHTAAVAADNGRWQGLLLATYRQGHETKNHGSDHALNINRTAPNPGDYYSQYLLTKVAVAVDTHHQLVTVLEKRHRKQNTAVYSARSASALIPMSTTDLSTDDRIERHRLSLEHRFGDMNAAWIQKAETRLYWQEANTLQSAIEARYSSPERTRSNCYAQNIFGIGTLLESNLTGWLNQRLSYGFDWSRAAISAQRSGTVPFPSPFFPKKPFPNTAYTLAGAFVQSEVEVGGFSIIPGVRFDYYRLVPSSEAYPEPIASLSDQAVTPRLGLVWRLSPVFAPYAQLATGFRAPSPDQVNNAFNNLAVGYRSIGNARLKAEHVDSVEIGVRGSAHNVRYSLAVFDNRYQDFISHQIVSGAATPANPSIYQYINLSHVRIRGAEMRGQWQLNKRWTANIGVAATRGDSETKVIKVPLDTIQPLRAVLGLNYDEQAWGARAHLLFSQRKSTNRIAAAPTPLFASPSYTVLDVGAYWKPAHNLTFTANVNNVFNIKYWRWSDLYGLEDNSPIKDAYTAPPRNAQLAVRYDF